MSVSLSDFLSSSFEGAQGISGTQGIKGEKGDEGSQGIQGIQGLSGTQGLSGSGSQGIQGIQGTEGSQGIQGLFGPQGIQGLTNIPPSNFFILTNDRPTAVGIVSSSFFGLNSSAVLDSNSFYELNAYCFFIKNTAQRVFVTLNFSVAPSNVSAILNYGSSFGDTTSNTPNRISLFNSTSTNTFFTQTEVLSTGINHSFVINAIIVSPVGSSTNMGIDFRCGGGTLTPLRNSYYTVNKLPSSNIGNI